MFNTKKSTSFSTRSGEGRQDVVVGTLKKVKSEYKKCVVRATLILKDRE